jgi:dynein intermediate chain 2, axonemal
LRYCTKDANLIIGGQYNGQVAIWDVRKGSRPVERSALPVSHGDPAYKVVWVQSKTNTEFFSTSTDGQVWMIT